MAPTFLLVCLLALLTTIGGDRYVNNKKGIIQDIHSEKFKVYKKDPNRQFIEGDILVSSSRNAIQYDFNRWTNGVVPYVIDSAYPATEKAKILAAMKEIEYDVNSPNTTCVQFVPRTSQKHYIFVKPYEDECSSYVGNIHEGSQEVSLGEGCIVNGIIMHELVHALGFWHEQSRPDRDNYVDIIRSRIMQDSVDNYDKEYHARVLNAPYDYGSIMHYSPYEFALDENKPAMTPKPGKDVRTKMGQRSRLTPTDVVKIQRLYKCKEDTSHMKHQELECTFGSDDFCDLEKSGDFDWVAGQGKTTNSYGPQADSSTGTGYYALAKSYAHKGKVAYLKTKKAYTSDVICVNFQMYHYHGSSELAVGILNDGSTVMRGITAYDGQDERMWYDVSVEFQKSYRVKSYKVAIRATMGSNDIAVDDVMITEGRC